MIDFLIVIAVIALGALVGIGICALFSKPEPNYAYSESFRAYFEKEYLNEFIRNTKK